MSERTTILLLIPLEVAAPISLIFILLDIIYSQCVIAMYVFCIFFKRETCNVMIVYYFKIIIKEMVLSFILKFLFNPMIYFL